MSPVLKIESENMIIEAVRALRKDVGATKTQMASDLGLSVNTYAQWENGRRTPNLTTIIAMCETFGYSFELSPEKCGFKKIIEK